MTGRCRWIEGEPGTEPCGAETAPGRPYCPDHCVRAYGRRDRFGEFVPFRRAHFRELPKPLPWREINRMAGRMNG